MTLDKHWQYTMPNNDYELEVANKIVGKNRAYLYPVLELITGMPKKMPKKTIELCNKLIDLIVAGENIGRKGKLDA